MHKQVRQLTLAVVAVVVFAMPARAGQWQFDDIERVVAITDIHGAFGPMVRALQNAEVVDEALAWSGGKAHLVIVGDTLDRGPSSRDAMDLLMRLEGEAAEAGGKVHVLIGNHEAMNLVGDLRYVSSAEYAAFAEEELAADREHWFSAYTQNRASGDDSPEGLRILFNQKYPAGFFAHRRAFSSNGKYGEWLLSKPVVVVINGTAFVHGGLSPMIGEIGLDGVNGRLRSEMVEYVRQLEVLFEAGALLPTDSFHNHPALLQAFIPPLDTQVDVLQAIKAVQKLNDSNLHALDGPLWYRGNVVCSELVEADKIAATLQAIDATRVVVGHTPTPGRRVLERLDGRVIEIDTGMLNDYYGGKASVLIIDRGQLAVITENDSEPVLPLPHPRAVGARPGGSLSNEEIEQLLAHGDIVATSEDALGRKFVTLTDGERTLEAFSQKRAGRGFYPEVAAYRLDLLLGLEMVPVAVRREIGGADGSLQFRPKNWIDELERSREGRGGSAWCPLDEQWNAMFVYDALTYNMGRSGKNVLYNLDMWQLMLIGHDRAFVAKRGTPQHLESVPFLVGQGWKDALSSLSDEVLEERLGDVLSERRLRSLATRRDELLEHP
ncbi:MAG: metallophosphoesterase [Gammaproteobacteria bacterium]|nr:metallophosphoesterase [Gammaproteobacteria bacterium]MDH3750724.1 metallophosphoesterase [Gammaproteobacteria bacterium]